MSEELKKELTEVVRLSIEKHVNGGIRELTAKLDAHIVKMEPVFEVYDTATRTGNGVMWISKVMLAIAAIVGSVAGLAKFFKNY